MNGTKLRKPRVNNHTIVEVNVADEIESELSEVESTHSNPEAESSDDPEGEIYKNLTEEQLHRAREYFECFICNVRMSNFSNFRIHVFRHTSAKGAKKYKCEVCSKDFAKLRYLKAHLTTHNENRIFTCEICSQNFATKPSIRGHMRIHTGEKPYACTVCGKAFTESSTRRKHMLTHFPERKSAMETETYSCEICGKMISGKHSFKRHMKIHTRQKLAETEEPQQCPVCNKKVFSNFKQHIKNHATERTFKCTLCDAVFKNAYGVKVHMVTHTGKKDYCCSVCQKEFGTSSNLANHIRIHTGDKRFVCGTCNRAFTLHSTLRKHLVTHGNRDGNMSGKNFECHICSKLFAMEYLLRAHIVIHTENRPKEHICSLCSKGFYHRSSLLKHMKRPCFRAKPVFQCEICAAQFKENNILMRHLARHQKRAEMQGDVEGSCKFCGKIFPTSRGLTVHLSTHFADKKFQCPISMCSHKYTTVGKLKKHILSVHGDHLLECEICRKSNFTSQEKLEVHRTQHFAKNEAEDSAIGSAQLIPMPLISMPEKESINVPVCSNLILSNWMEN